MRVPTFEKSNILNGVYRVDCMIASMRNSEVPEVAVNHMREYGVDELFEVALLGVDGGAITEWHASVIQRLFSKEELVSAVKACLKDLVESDSELFPDILREDVLSWVYVNCVIIDGLQKRISVSLGTIQDLHLIEHGLEIYCDEEGWRCNLDEDFGTYPCDTENDPRYKRLES